MTNGHVCYSFSKRHHNESQILVTTLKGSPFSKLWQEEWCYIREQQGKPYGAVWSALRVLQGEKWHHVDFGAHSCDTSSLSFPGKIEVRVQLVLVTQDGQLGWRVTCTETVSALALRHGCSPEAPVIRLIWVQLSTSQSGRPRLTTCLMWFPILFLMKRGQAAAFCWSHSITARMCASTCA